MSYARMTQSDLDEVVALEASVHDFPWTHGNFRDSLLAGHACWIRRENGRVIAIAVVMEVVDEIHLLDIAVAREYQRCGIGAQLLSFLCEQARKSGMNRMLLEVRPANVMAIAFYGGIGFAEIGRRRGYYPALKGREDAIVMAKGL